MQQPSFLFLPSFRKSQTLQLPTRFLLANGFLLRPLPFTDVAEIGGGVSRIKNATFMISRIDVTKLKSLLKNVCMTFAIEREQ